MITEYVTRDGYRLTIGRVPRQDIDRFVAAHPMPEPPMRTVEVWGDVPEEIPDYDDLEYLKALDGYLVALGKAQFDLILQAVELDDERARQDARDLRALKVLEGDGDGPFVKHILTTSLEDIKAVTEAIFYNSTVTPKGIAEAVEAYDVTYMDKRVTLAGAPPKSGVTVGRLYADRTAAHWDGYKWDEFCALTGPEQSAVVALHQLSHRVELMRRA